MTDTPHINGVAREGVAVLRQRMDDCQAASREHRERTSAEVHTLRTKLDNLEDRMLVMQTRLGMWAALGAAVASILVQLGFKLLG